MKFQRYHLIISVLIVIVLFIGSTMSLIGQEPPHLIHTYNHNAEIRSNYYSTGGDFYRSRGMTTIYPTFNDIKNVSNIYKVSLTGTATSSRDNGYISYMLNDDCVTTSYLKLGITYNYPKCTTKNNGLVYVQDGRLSSFNSIIPMDGDLRQISFNNYIDYTRKGIIYNLEVQVYEEVECTDDTHCVTNAPTCNTQLNVCEQSLEQLTDIRDIAQSEVTYISLLTDNINVLIFKIQLWIGNLL